MNGPLPQIPDVPDILLKREPDAVFSWESTGHLVVVENDETVRLSRDDLISLSRFFDQFRRDA